MTFKPLTLAPLLLALCCQAPQVRTEADESIKVHFTLGDSPTAAIVDTLDNAQESVHVQAYSFTSAPHSRRAETRTRQGRGGEGHTRQEPENREVHQRDISDPRWHTSLDRQQTPIAHNKVMIVDSSIVITGSFNITRGAEERNAENLLVISGGPTTNRHLANWEKCKAHSEEIL